MGTSVVLEKDNVEISKSRTVGEYISNKEYFTNYNVSAVHNDFTLECKIQPIEFNAGSKTGFSQWLDGSLLISVTCLDNNSETQISLDTKINFDMQKLFVNDKNNVMFNSSGLYDECATLNRNIQNKVFDFLANKEFNTNYDTTKDVLKEALILKDFVNKEISNLESDILKDLAQLDSSADYSMNSFKIRDNVEIGFGIELDTLCQVKEELGLGKLFVNKDYDVVNSGVEFYHDGLFTDISINNRDVLYATIKYDDQTLSLYSEQNRKPELINRVYGSTHKEITITNNDVSIMPNYLKDVNVDYMDIKDGNNYLFEALDNSLSLILDEKHQHIFMPKLETMKTELDQTLDNLDIKQKERNKTEISKNDIDL